MADTSGGKIVWDLDVNVEPLRKGLKEANDTISDSGKDVSKSIKGIGKSVSGFGDEIRNTGKDLSVAITAPIVAVSAVAFKFTELAGRYSSVEDAFKSMTKGMSVDAKKFQKDVAAATGGQIDNLTILQGATRGLALIGKDAFNDFSKDFVKMAELSKKAARATGQDVNFMFDSLVLGISRESKLILDNLGVSVDLTKAKEDYAKSLGKEVDALTQSEAKHAVLNATLNQLETTYGNVAVSAGGFSGAWQQLTTILTNAQIQIGQELEPSMAQLIKSTSSLAKEIIPQVIEILRIAITWWTSLDAEVQKNIITVLAIITVFGPLLVIIGSVISSIGVIINAFGGFISILGVAIGVLTKLSFIFGIIKVGAIAFGTFLAGLSAPVWIIIGVITALIAIGVLLYKNWDKIKEVGGAALNWLSDRWRQFADWIRGVTDKIGESMQKLNPFHRNSPSLIDNIKAGVKLIESEYGGLAGLKIPTLSAQVEPSSFSDPVSSTLGNTPKASSKSNVIVNIGEVNNASDIDMLSREIGFRLAIA